MYGEEFFMRVSTITWKNSRGYILVELVLRYSDTSYRIANGSGTFWCAIEDSFDRALVKACAQIKAQME
jgi:hypothetical protein